MNILVTGAKGQLGSCLRQLLNDTSSNTYIFTDVDELDITDKSSVINAIQKQAIDIIVNCAGYTNVNKAENDLDAALALNAQGVANLAEAAKSNNALLIHISTDYIFGGNGNNRPIAETEPAKPLNMYGLSKLKGEEAIVGIGCRHIIIRTQWLYSEFGNNFVKSVLGSLQTESTIKVVIDQTGSPTYARDLAEFILLIIEQKLFIDNEGIYNYSNEGVCSWFDFAFEIARLAHRHKCSILPCKSTDLKSGAIRPAYSVLDKTKIKTVFGVHPHHWQESLSDCMSNLGIYKGTL